MFRLIIIAAVFGTVVLVAEMPEAKAQAVVTSYYQPAPAAVGYVPVRAGLFGLRTAWAPVVVPAAPVPVTTTYYAPAPVTTYYAPAPAPTVSAYYAPVPVTTYYAPAPRVYTYYTPAAPAVIIGR